MNVSSAFGISGSATRTLAAELAISRTAVLAAYDELAAAGFVQAVGGSATVVSPGADLAARAGVSSHVPAPLAASLAASLAAGPGAVAGPRWNLLPGYPDTGLIAASHWRAAWRAAARLPASFSSPFGQPVAFEQPGYLEGRSALSSAGAVIRPVPVGDAGLDPAGLAVGDAAVYVTPAHQFPLGARLSAARRAALIGWARRAGALVIEDDYDGEFRFDVRGLPALHSMTGGPDVVAYLGTASKILSPGLRVAWMIVPPDLRPAVRDTLAVTDETISVPAGDALAHFIASGHLASHLARAARTYAARRRALIAGLLGCAPGLRISGVDAGLHLVADLPPGGPGEASVQRDLAASGLAVDVLGQFSTAPLTRQALVCGYAQLPETQAAAAAAAIGRSVAAAGLG